MPAAISRQTSVKRKRDDSTPKTPTKRRVLAQEAPLRSPDTSLTREVKDATDEEEELTTSRQRLLKLFCAIETTLTSSLGASSFHSIQRAVSNTARCDFELDNLAQILGVWDNAYDVEPVMALVNGNRKPSISISRAQQATTTVTIERREEFVYRLEAWDGKHGVLPELKEQTMMPLNASKIASIQRDKDLTSSPVSHTSSSPNARDRQSALLDRIRMKAINKSTEPTSEDLKSATITALVPAAITSIKIMLASRKTKAIGMTELCDNLGTSLSQRIGKDDVERLIDQLSHHPVYSKWCKVGAVGDVKVVRFVGAAPAVSTSL